MLLFEILDKVIHWIRLTFPLDFTDDTLLQSFK